MAWWRWLQNLRTAGGVAGVQLAGPADVGGSVALVAPDVAVAVPASADPPARAGGASEASESAEPSAGSPMRSTTDLFKMSRVGLVNVIELTLPPTLDIDEFDRLNESLLAVVRAEPGAGWVLDLSRLSYVGSALLGLMVNMRQQIKQSGGRMALCGLSPQLVHIFNTCCMERLFRIVKSRADAVSAAE